MKGHLDQSQRVCSIAIKKDIVKIFLLKCMYCNKNEFYSNQVECATFNGDESDKSVLVDKQFIACTTLLIN